VVYLGGGGGGRDRQGLLASGGSCRTRSLKTRRRRNNKQNKPRHSTTGYAHVLNSNGTIISAESAYSTHLCGYAGDRHGGGRHTLGSPAAITTQHRINPSHFAKTSSCLLHHRLYVLWPLDGFYLRLGQVAATSDGGGDEVAEFRGLRANDHMSTTDGGNTIQ
jgi:hypothetical protein